MNDETTRAPETEPATTAMTKPAPRLLRVRTGVRAGSLNAYFSKVQGEKQGAFKGG